MTARRCVEENLYRMWADENDQVLKHKGRFIPLFKRLRDKTFSKRGFSWSGKLLSSLLLTLTHTYPLEDKFVNCDEWDSEGKIKLYRYVFSDESRTFLQTSVSTITNTGGNSILLRMSRYVCVLPITA